MTDHGQQAGLFLLSGLGHCRLLPGQGGGFQRLGVVRLDATQVEQEGEV